MIFSLIRSRAPSVDPILISVQVYRRKVGRVLLDGGAFCDIIYEHYFLKLRKEVRERRKDIYTTLSGFFGEQVIPLGEISLQITIGEAPKITRTQRRPEDSRFCAWSQNKLFEETTSEGRLVTFIDSSTGEQSLEGETVGRFQKKEQREARQYCEIHQDYGHDTNACRELKNQIEEAVKSEKLAHLINGIRIGRAKQADNQLREWAAPAVKTKPDVDGK
ncbi:hypothetical protein Tco_0098257 [Tanacetum coccineum]